MGQELHDPAPGEMRKQHLLNEITRDPGKAWRSLLRFRIPRQRVRLAIALGLVAASAGAIVGGLSLTRTPRFSG